jgi:hypothetical protein
MSVFSINTRIIAVKKLLFVTAVAAMVASPAFAQSPRQIRAMQESDAAAEVFAAQIRNPSLDRINPNSVYSNGEYVGTDPDLSVRHQLLLDGPILTGGAG